MSDWVLDDIVDKNYRDQFLMNHLIDSRSWKQTFQMSSSFIVDPELVVVV